MDAKVSKQRLCADSEPTLRRWCRVFLLNMDCFVYFVCALCCWFFQPVLSLVFLAERPLIMQMFVAPQNVHHLLTLQLRLPKRRIGSATVLQALKSECKKQAKTDGEIEKKKRKQKKKVSGVSVRRSPTRWRHGQQLSSPQCSHFHKLRWLLQRRTNAQYEMSALQTGVQTHLLSRALAI